MNFNKRSYQPILRYLYTEATKRQGEISLHKHFKEPEDEDFFSDDTVDENGEPRLVWSFFERPDDNIHMDENAGSDTMQDNQALPPNTPSIPVKSLESIYISLLMDNNQELSSLPNNLDVKNYLKEEKTLKVQSYRPSTSGYGSFE